MTPDTPSPSDSAFESQHSIEVEVPSKWPTVIGVISLIYAIGGMLCSVGIMASGFFTEAMMAMGGMKIEMPPIIKITSAVHGLLLLVAGIVLISGAIGTLRRKRSGPGVIRAWVVYRIALLLIGAVTTVLTAPAQVQFQRSMLDAQQERIDASGGGIVVNNATDEEIWRNMMIGMGAMSLVFAAYPIFVGFYLSRKRIVEEVSTWP